MKKKLLFVNGHLNIGGVEKSLVDILKNIDYSRYEVDLLLLQGLGEYKDQVPSQVKIIERSLKGTYGSFILCILNCVKRKDWFSLKLRCIFMLMKYFGQEKLSLSKKMFTSGKHYNCAIGFRGDICSQIVAFATNADKKITWWHHGEVNVNIESYSKMISNFDKIVVVSDSCKRMLAQEIPATREKMIVISNMINKDEIVQKAEQFNPYIENTNWKIVTVSRFAPEKHIENIIFAAKKLKEQDIAFEWYLVGDGSLRKQIEEEVKKGNLKGYVNFVGSQANPYPYMKYANLFVHPSYVESQGLVVLEALALGVPCVVTKSKGVCEFIEDGKNGILTEQNGKSLTESVEKMITNKELYQHIKQNTKCPEKFFPKVVIGKFVKILG